VERKKGIAAGVPVLFLCLIILPVFIGCDLAQHANDAGWWFQAPVLGTVITYQIVKEYQDGSVSEETAVYTHTGAFTIDGVQYFSFENDTGDIFFYILDERNGTLYRSKTTGITDDGTLCVFKTPVVEAGEYTYQNTTYTYESIGGNYSSGSTIIRNVLEVDADNLIGFGETISYVWSREYFIVSYKETFGLADFLSSYKQLLLTYEEPQG